MPTAFNIDKWQAGLGENINELTLEGSCFEAYWDNLPNKSDNNTLEINGYSFIGRMSLLKTILYLDDTDERQKHQNYLIHHWIWAYASQLDWQHRSGRLAVGGKGKEANDDIISHESFWGYMNFCFTVCLYLGAEGSGLMKGRIKLLDDYSQSLIDEDPVVSACIRSWKEFFQSAYVKYKETLAHPNLSEIELEEAVFLLHKSCWQAHSFVIHAHIGTDFSNPSNSKVKELFEILPPSERKFSLGFCRMVDLLAVICIPTDLRSLYRDGAGYLPIEVVTEEKLIKWRKDDYKKKEINYRRLVTVESIINLSSASPQSYQLVMSFYKRIVRSHVIAHAMPRTLFEISFGKLHQKILQVCKLTYLFIRPRGLLEYAATIGLGMGFSAYCIFTRSSYTKLKI